MDTPPPPGRLRVELELDQEVVSQAQRGAPNLSRLVDRLLRDYLAERERLEPERRAHAEAHVRASNAVIEKHGLWGEEFSTL
jgi:uncharacterized membrane protein